MQALQLNFEISVPLRKKKKKKVLDYFPNPDEFPRNVHPVTPTFIYRKY